MTKDDTANQMYKHVDLILIILFLELTVQLHVEWNWTDDLEDQNSVAFKELSRVFEKEVTIALTCIRVKWK